MRVEKFGEELAVRLPTSLVEELEIVAGDELIIVAASRHRLALAKADARNTFLERMDAFRFDLPAGYRFDRDEANER